MSYHSITFGEGQTAKNTWDDWHLVPTSRPLVAPPAVTQNQIAIPGVDGFIDLTEALAGRTTYGARSGSWEFAAHPFYSEEEPWYDKYSTIMAYLHGQEMRVILEDDPNYFYYGRMVVNSWKSNDYWSTITIDYVLQPYKEHISTHSKVL